MPTNAQEQQKDTNTDPESFERKLLQYFLFFRQIIFFYQFLISVNLQKVRNIENMRVCMELKRINKSLWTLKTGVLWWSKSCCLFLSCFWDHVPRSCPGSLRFLARECPHWKYWCSGGWSYIHLSYQGFPRCHLNPWGWNLFSFFWGCTHQAHNWQANIEDDANFCINSPQDPSKHSNHPRCVPEKSFLQETRFSIFPLVYLAGGHSSPTWCLRFSPTQRP